ncbi:MAG: PqqD family protein [Alphaproteobacteria bacterium]|nr:PqqD family protein [Alphaproteobacteria bacterium]MBU0796803.1 PqqD family protein [Alphaproteobacteria bacterium]MBU0885839.1 PqqD family protein [Alphaproteobacteria bacterium]MBU1812084.1 PqqD family protein [Alphaproteobacteria bacterium]MBU2091512.1 PqqD family protein [Alphaproteobacteria bacterium]
MSRSLHRVGDVFAAPLENTTLLLNAATGCYHGLNPVAARIWELLADPITEEQIVARLLEEFEVTPEVCRAETASFLAGLRDRNLLIAD